MVTVTVRGNSLKQHETKMLFTIGESNAVIQAQAKHRIAKSLARN
jgi:hypothetical protein